jgi:hypothetical protein
MTVATLVLLFNMFLIKEQQELLIRIINTISEFMNNPLFAEYGKLGLFVNGIFSTFILFHLRSQP